MDLEKAEERGTKLQTSTGSQKKQGNSKKTSTSASASFDYAKAFDYVDHNKLENSSRDGNTRPPYLSPEKLVCRLQRAEQTRTTQSAGNKQGAQQ